MITLEQLRTFLWVARLGGLRKAASEMNLSQPAVSARISGLEDALKTKLFERTSNGVQLTRQGNILRKHAEQIALSLEHIKADVIPTEEMTSTIRLGVAETVAQAWLPNFLTILRERYPQLTIEVTVDVTVNLREQLLARALDLAFLMGPISNYNVENLDLPAFELSWFRPCNGLLEDDAISLEDVAQILATTPIISYNRNSRPYRELRQELAERYGVETRIFPSNSLSAGFEMVAKGIGVGLLPRVLGKSHLQAGRLIEFDPGWCPKPLHFTASYICDPPDHLIARTAKLARTCAQEWNEAH